MLDADERKKSEKLRRTLWLVIVLGIGAALSWPLITRTVSPQLAVDIAHRRNFVFVPPYGWLQNSEPRNVLPAWIYGAHSDPWGSNWVHEGSSTAPYSPGPNTVDEGGAGDDLGPSERAKSPLLDLLDWPKFHACLLALSLGWVLWRLRSIRPPGSAALVQRSLVVASVPTLLWSWQLSWAASVLLPETAFGAWVLLDPWIAGALTCAGIWFLFALGLTATTPVEGVVET